MLDYCEQEQVFRFSFKSSCAKHWKTFNFYANVNIMIQLNAIIQMTKGDLALCCFLIGGYNIDSATSMSWVSGEDLAYTNW